MQGELVQRVVEACTSWPEGQGGEVEGVARLLGGMMNDKVSYWSRRWRRPYVYREKDRETYT